MSYYKSVRLVDVEQPVVLSFDVSKKDMSFVLGLEDSIQLSIDTNNNTDSITETIENSLISDPDTTHEDNTFGGEKVIIEQDESQSGVLDSNNNIIKDRPDLIEKSDNFIVFSDSLNSISNGSVIFFLTETPSSDNVIYSELGTYEQKYGDSITITPFVLDSCDNDPLLIDVDDESLTFLLLGHECSKDFSLSPTTVFTKKVNDNKSFEYQQTNEITNSYRARFVISNNGRIITFSVYNNDNKNWDVIKELVFDTEKINGKHHVVFSVNDTQAISNITANF